MGSNQAIYWRIDPSILILNSLLDPHPIILLLLVTHSLHSGRAFTLNTNFIWNWDPTFFKIRDLISKQETRLKIVKAKEKISHVNVAVDTCNAKRRFTADVQLMIADTWKVILTDFWSQSTNLSRIRSI